MNKLMKKVNGGGYESTFSQFTKSLRKEATNVVSFTKGGAKL